MAALTAESINKTRLIKDFHAIGVERGDHLSIGVSLKSIGHIEGGPDTFLDALLEVVGPNGTVMANTFTREFSLSKLVTGQDHQIFDHSSTPASTGIVAERLRKRKGALRSRHPHYSVAAVGRLADYFTRGHDHRSRAFGPNVKLAQVGGKVLSIGIGDRVAGFSHTAQQQAGLLSVVPIKYGVRFVDSHGGIGTFIAKDTPGCAKQLFKPVLLVKKKGGVTDGYIGASRSVLVSAAKALRIMTQMLKQMPQVNLCDNISCLWCRELERRLNLYSDIENPHWFQRYPPVIALIASINWFRLGGNPVVIKLRQLANALGVHPHTIYTVINDNIHFRHPA